MKKLVLVLSVLGLMLASSCSSVRVAVDMNKKADFSQYKTYSFLGWQNNSDEKLDEFDKKRLRDAFKAEFDKRGMNYVQEGGDIEITLFIVLNPKTSTTAYTDYYTGGYSNYYRYRGGWGYGYSTTTFEENDYIEGTLIMDVFDGKSKEQVWEAVAKSTVVDDPIKRTKTIPKKVKQLMQRFPVYPVK